MITNEKRVDRPVRVVTEQNATVADRASVWRSVELALVAVNQRADELQVPGVAELSEAQSAYHYATTAAPAGGALRAQAWHRAVLAQFTLLETCTLPAWVEQMYDALDALRTAREHYLSIGGLPSRAPMVGGIS